MTVGSLFAGIGGFELAAQWAGLTPIWSNEIDPFCCAVLQKNFKHRIIEDDIKNIGKHNLEPVDILTGGFPCQPFSTAGKRKGKEDHRHLWPQMLRVIGEISPSIVVGENVYGLLNWSGGLVFNEVQSDLENLGYSVTPFVLPACGIQAPHRRDRVWFVAHSGSLNGSISVQQRGQREAGNIDTDWDDEKRIATYSKVNGNNGGLSVLEKANVRKQTRKESRQEKSTIGGDCGTLTNNNKGLQGGKIGRSTGKIGPKQGQFVAGLLQPTWQDFPTQSPVCGGNDGLPNRVDRIKSLGNAIVPQVALEIFKAIKEVEGLIKGKMI